ncbi:hypothetical protein Vretimale_8936, partial [Volvox reticuliferus]
RGRWWPVGFGKVVGGEGLQPPESCLGDIVRDREVEVSCVDFVEVKLGASIKKDQPHDNVIRLPPDDQPGQVTPLTTGARNEHSLLMLNFHQQVDVGKSALGLCSVIIECTKLGCVSHLIGDVVAVQEGLIEGENTRIP